MRCLRRRSNCLHVPLEYPRHWGNQVAFVACDRLIGLPSTNWDKAVTDKPLICIFFFNKKQVTAAGDKCLLCKSAVPLYFE